MGQVIIRNLDDQVIDRLKERAKRKGHSLEQELREALIHAAKLTAEERVALSRSVRSMTPPGPHPLAEDLIREDRDSR